MHSNMGVKPMNTVNVAAIASRLDDAWRARRPIAPISESDGVADAATAYAIQDRWTGLRLARGEKIAGRKIGLTAKAVQQQLGVPIDVTREGAQAAVPHAQRDEQLAAGE